MSLTRSWKGPWLALLLAGVTATALLQKEPSAVAARSPTPHKKTQLRLVTLEGGERALLDAGGQAVPLRHYEHIAAGSSLADDLLLALAEPERIALLTRYGREHKRDAFRYGQRPTLGGPLDLEQLRRADVDLLVLNHMGAPAELARVRDLGIQVFNLGEMRGLRTLVPNIQALSLLLGDEARGAELAEKLLRRMRNVAADIPAHKRRRALYVSAYGGQLFGGALGTSYHDVLQAAGLLDIAADSFRDWPHYDPEQLLMLDPDLIVTQPASIELVCRVSGLVRLRACEDGHKGIIALDDALLGDPGLGMLDAAEALRDRVYGPP